MFELKNWILIFIYYEKESKENICIFFGDGEPIELLFVNNKKCFKIFKLPKTLIIL